MDAPLLGLDAQEEMGSNLQQVPLYEAPYARQRSASRAQQQQAAAETISQLQSEALAEQLQQVMLLST